MTLSPRGRLLRTIAFEPTDYVPLSVLLWSSLWERCASAEDCVRRQLDLGMDPVVHLPSVPWGRNAAVESRIRTEVAGAARLIHKEYHTPAGELTAVAEMTADWPHGEDVPLLSDFNIPRSRKFLVTGPEDLEPLSELLAAPGAGEEAQFQRACRDARRIADRYALATTSPIVRLVDTVCWLCGPERMATWGLDDPGSFREFVDIVARWQDTASVICLKAGPDIRVRAEWYASPFLSPALFMRFFGPHISRDVERAHAAGAKYCYVATASVMPFIACLKELDIDVLYGVDPVEGNWDLAAARGECGADVALWGGVNGYLQVVFGSPERTAEAVETAIEVLAPGGGFILCPVDDIGLAGTHQDTDEVWQQTWRNVAHMVDAWKRLRGL
jgi:hypothetical protein